MIIIQSLLVFLRHISIPTSSINSLSFRSSCPEVLREEGVLRNFSKFTGKHLCQSLFFNKVAGLRPATLLKKKLWHSCFPLNFTKFLRAPFLQNWLLLFLPFFLQISLYICFVQVFAIFLEYVPLNTPSLITSVGVLPVPKSISCKQ